MAPRLYLALRLRLRVQRVPLLAKAAARMERRLNGGGQEARPRRPRGMPGDRDVAAARMERGLDGGGQEAHPRRPPDKPVIETSRPRGSHEGAARAAKKHVLDGHRTCHVIETSRPRGSNEGATRAAKKHVLDGHRTSHVIETSRPRGSNEGATRAARKHVLDGHRTCRAGETSQPRGWNGGRNGCGRGACPRRRPDMPGERDFAAPGVKRG